MLKETLNSATKAARAMADVFGNRRRCCVEEMQSFPAFFMD